MSQTNGDPVMYGLYAVLVHSGYSCHAGHYYCYVKVSPGCAPAPLWAGLVLLVGPCRAWDGCSAGVCGPEGPWAGPDPPLCSPSGQQRAVVSDERLPGPLQQHQGGPQPAGLRALLPEVRCPAPPCPATPVLQRVSCVVGPGWQRVPRVVGCAGWEGRGGRDLAAGQGSCVDEEHVAASELPPPAAPVRL